MNKDLIIQKQKELIALLDDCNFSTTVSQEEWRKRKVLYDELSALESETEPAKTTDHITLTEEGAEIFNSGC